MFKFCISFIGADSDGEPVELAHLHCSCMTPREAVEDACMQLIAQNVSTEGVLAVEVTTGIRWGGTEQAQAFEKARNSVNGGRAPTVMQPLGPDEEPLSDEDAPDGGAAKGDDSGPVG